MYLVIGFIILFKEEIYKNLIKLKFVVHFYYLPFVIKIIYLTIFLKYFYKITLALK